MGSPRTAVMVATAAGAGLGLLLPKLWRRVRAARPRSDGGGAPCLEPAPGPGAPPAPRRFGAAIRLRSDRYARYRELHDDVWQGVLDVMTRANVRNFVIYYHKETGMMFQHFEWVGHWTRPCRTRQEEEELFRGDMDLIANDPVTRTWWKECEPCQESLSWPDGALPPSQGGPGKEYKDASWWSSCECVAYCGHWPLSYAKDQRDADFEKLK